MEDKGKILIIKSFRDEFEKYYNCKMKQEGVEIWNENIFNKGFHKNLIIRQFQMCFRMVKNNWISHIKKYEIIIIFDAYSLIPWIFLIKRRKARIILWEWNIATPGTVRRIKFVQKMCEVWTFNENDAQQYGWQLNNQFFFTSNIENSGCISDGKKKYTVFFIGLDKGRYKCLHNIFKLLQHKGIQCDFYLVGDEREQYDKADSGWIKSKSIPYSQVLEHVSKCDAILDFVQDGQNGFTLRVLEALFYQKKLITNNGDILNSDVYSPDNIFVIGYDSWDDLSVFMQKPFQVLPSDLLDNYTFDGWLKNFKKPLNFV